MNKAIVIIEVNGGVASFTVRNCDNPVQVVIIDHDNPSVEFIEDPPNILLDGECAEYVQKYEKKYYPDNEDPA